MAILLWKEDSLCKLQKIYFSTHRDNEKIENLTYQDAEQPQAPALGSGWQPQEH